MSDILLMEAANLFVGDHDPERSKHLKIKNLTLPTLEFITADHAGGGAAMEVGWSMGILRKLELGFALVGFDEECYRAAGVGSNQVVNFTAYGVISRKSDGRKFGVKAVVKGSLGKVAPDQFERSSALGHDHSLADVTYYKLTVGRDEWFEADFFNTVRKRFGVDELAEVRTLLGLN